MRQIVLAGARILTASAGNLPPVIEDGTILLSDGKIAAIGTPFEIPKDATVIPVDGKIVTPGFLDAHCHIGIAEDGAGWAGEDSNEASDPITPQARALDAINPQDMAFRDAVAAGITCVQVDPGSANIIGGESLVMKTWGKIIDDLVVKRPSGLKAALGENPKRAYGSQRKSPATRMGNAAVMRKAFYAAKDYERKLGTAEPDKALERSLKNEMMLRVLHREIPLRIHCHRTDDIMTAIRIAREFGVDASLEHCTEGDQIVDAVLESGFPVTVGPSLTDKSKLEVRDIGFRTPVALSKAGIKLAIVTDHPVFPIQYLRICAGLCIRWGMDEEIALLAVTRHAAEITGVGDRVGSLDAGKDADLVVWSGDPFEYNTKAELTIIDGIPVDLGAKGGRAR